MYFPAFFPDLKWNNFAERLVPGTSRMKNLKTGQEKFFGYRWVPARLKIMGTGYRPNFESCRPLASLRILSDGLNSHAPVAPELLKKAPIHISSKRGIRLNSFLPENSGSPDLHRSKHFCAILIQFHVINYNL